MGSVLPSVEAILQNDSKLIDFGRTYLTCLISGAGTALPLVLLRPDRFAMTIATDLRLISVDYLVGVVKSLSKFKQPLRLFGIVPVAAIGKSRAATDKIAADNAWISGICCAPSAARSKLDLTEK